MMRPEVENEPQYAPPVTTDRISRELLEGIFASDQDMYPAPLTRERLRGWTEAAPEFALSLWFTAAGRSPSPSPRLVGAVIALPILASSWRDLLVGEVKETDVDPATMFPGAGDRDVEVGLHVFHVERYEAAEAQGRVPKIANMSLKAVGEAAKRRGWRIVGYSALTATPEGRRCFDDMGFEPTGYEEFWVSSGSSPNKVQLVTMSAETARETKIPGKEFVKGHATMLATEHLCL